ncbi:glucose-6-phosphate dehydrogenase (NADP(+)) [Patescibacteria group bacterium]|nr:glucose-6-phosphate dehydrogenase (NADP(+)) [Patescibacteria group bacterium]
MDSAIPALLVIIGITGDLAGRKLLPAIEAIARAGALPKDSRIIGTTRQGSIPVERVNAATMPHVRDRLQFFTMDTDDPRAYARLKARLALIEQELGTRAQRLFYMSVPPRAVRPIVEHLGVSGLARIPETKLLLEKPFGTDLASAADLAEHIGAHFASEQVYRIDHYLAKHMAQDLIVFRERNSLFRRTWNGDFIERIEIRASETIGIEGRARFYEQTGALRDVMQSHLLQLAALTLMALPNGQEIESIPKRRHAALQRVRLSGAARRGQYAGYRTEVGNPASTVETYVDLTLESTAPQWKGVPIRLMTGKRLSKKTTEIRVYYKRDRDQEANELVLHLQPNEGMALAIWSGRPGYEGLVEKQTLGFAYADYYTALPDAYEKVLVDVMRGDHDLFVSSEEVLESWRILAPLQKKWATTSDDLFTYEPGSDL